MNRQSTAAVLALAAAALLATGCSTTEPMSAAAQNMLLGSASHFDSTGIIDAGRGDGKPFFAYLAFTAPRWPRHAPDEFIKKYEGKYDAGYDAIRDARVARMKALGLIPKDSGVYAGNPVWPK